MSTRAAYTQLNSFFVSFYKLFGFATLLIILLGLIAYVVVQVFYLVNQSWVAPVILSPSHQRVLELNAKLTNQRYLRDKLSAEKLEVLAELEAIERLMASSASLEERFGATVSSDLQARRRELRQLGALLEQHRRSRVEIEQQSTQFAGLSKERLAQELEAQLIDRDAFVNGQFQVARVEQMSLSLAQAEAKLEAEVKELSRQVTALEAVAERSEGKAGAGLTREVLLLEKDLMRLALDREHARGRIAPLQKQLEVIEQTLANYDEIIAAIQASPYLRAFASRVNLAFVPYENLEEVTEGAAIYGCELGLVWCEKAGEVMRVLDGEVTVRHPLHNRDLRGVMVEIRLDTPRWGEEPALHAGNAPFFF